MGRKKEVVNKDEMSEGCCFVCKDGGTLRVCDYKDCLKAYHANCVEKDDNFLESEIPWSCNWHSCFICKKTAKFNCFCCPNAVCGCCLCDSNFAIVKAKRGFCGHCLILAGLVEGLTSVDFNEVKVNLSLQDSYEFLFKSYWEFIKEKEGLTSKHVNYAHFLLNDNRNYDSNLSDDYIEEGGLSDFEDQHIMIDSLDFVTEHKPSHRRKKIKGKPNTEKRKEKSKTKEFLGWGSKGLLEFLTSVGQETNKELSQHDVATIISRYCRDNNLIDPLKKKKIICDEKLRALLGRKFVNKNSIYKLLTNHFAENFEDSENEFGNFGYSSEEEGRNALSPCKRQKNSSLDRKSQNKEVVSDIQRSCFASIIPRNIKLVYLRRSVLEELLKQPETFDANVTGSFVRVKADPNDWLQKNSHQLVQVIGINKNSINGEMNSDILLQLSNRVSDVPISKVSEDDFSEEECQDLHQRVKDGLLRRPTVVEFEEKARTLHEISKWIAKELAVLSNLINQANEKGWRREFSEYMDRKLLLQTPVEQSRLLHEVPEVIADEIEVQTSCKDMSRKDGQTDLPKSPLKGTSQPPKTSSEGIRSSPCCLDDGATVAAKKQYEGAFEEIQQQSHTRSHDDKDAGVIQTQRKGYFEEVNKNHWRTSPPKIFSGQTPIPFSQGMPGAFLPQEQCQSVNSISRDEQNEQADIECQNKKRRTARDGSIEPSEPRFKLILLSDNEEEDPSVAANHTADKQHYKGPASEENVQLHSLAHDTQDGGTLRTEGNGVCQVKDTNTRAVQAEPFPAKILASISPGQPNVLPQEQYRPGNNISKTKQNGQVNVAHENKKQSAPAAELIELSDDEKEDSSAAANKQAIQDLNCSIWYCCSPNGLKVGPYSILLLKEWSDSDSCVLKWKVWKTGQSLEEAIFLNDALRQVFHGKK